MNLNYHKYIETGRLDFHVHCAVLYNSPLFYLVFKLVRAGQKLATISSSIQL